MLSLYEGGWYCAEEMLSDMDSGGYVAAVSRAYGVKGGALRSGVGQVVCGELASVSRNNGVIHSAKEDVR